MVWHRLKNKRTIFLSVIGLLIIGLLLGLAIFLIYQKSTHVKMETNFIWGVSGKPMTDYATSYTENNINLGEQIILIKELNAGWYRGPFYKYDDYNKGRYDSLIQELGENNIRFLPTLMAHDNFDTLDKDALFQQAYDFAYGISSRYKGKITHYELENELDLRAIKSGVRGDTPTDYDEVKYQKTLAILRGLSAGVKKGDPSALTIVNTAGWFHYSYLDRLKTDNLNFDIIGWHLYSDQGDITHTCQSAYCINLAQRLASYSKDIWLTENDIRDGTLHKTEQEQADYIKKTATQIKSLPLFKAYFIYELLDSSYLDSSIPTQAHYGLVKITKNNNVWQVDAPKLAFSYYHDVINPPQVTSKPSAVTSTPISSSTPEISPKPEEISKTISPSGSPSSSIKTTTNKVSPSPTLSPSTLIGKIKTRVENISSPKKYNWLIYLGGSILIILGIIYLWRRHSQRY